MAIDRSLVSGSMGMLILRLLSEKDMYGYEMIDTLKKRSENVFELKAGTLYPLLHGCLLYTSVDTDAYLVWHQDEKIATLTTDRTGYAYLADLYIGSYYIREVTAGDGFVLNPEVQYFSITPQEQTVNFEWVSSDYVNARQKIRMGVEKTDVETKRCV